MAISRENYSADMWRRDGSSLIKGDGKSAVRYDLKMRQTSSLITDESIIDLVLNTLNDPKITDVTKNNINNLLTGKASKAYVGAFELEKAPQQDVKTGEVFTQVMQKKSPPPVPKRPSVRTPKVAPIPPMRIAPAQTNKVTQAVPKVVPEPFMQAERIGSWVFIFADNKLDNPLIVELKKGKPPTMQHGNLAELDNFVEKINTLLKKTTKNDYDKHVVNAIKKTVETKSSCSVTVDSKWYTLTPATIKPADIEKYKTVLSEREELIKENAPPPPLPKLPPIPPRRPTASGQTSPLDAVKGKPVPKPRDLSPRETDAE